MSLIKVKWRIRVTLGVHMKIVFLLLGNIVLNVCSLLEELGSQKEFLLVNVCLFSYLIMNMFSLK